MVIDYCKERGIDLKIFVSSCLKKQIDDKPSFHHYLNKKIFVETPAGDDCDLFILETAKQFNALVLSNDLFKNYASQYPIVRKRRVSFIIFDDTIIIPQLAVKGGEIFVQG